MNHSFSTDHATTYGLEEAIMIHSFQFWIAKNRANGQHLHDGRTWTYNTLAALRELFPYWTLNQVRRTIDALVAKGVLLKEHLGAREGWAATDRTLWYAFADESAFLPPARKPTAEREEEPPKAAYPIGENAKSAVPAILRNAQIEVAKSSNESKEQLGTCSYGHAVSDSSSSSPPACARTREPACKATAAAADSHTKDSDRGSDYREPHVWGKLPENPTPDDYARFMREHDEDEATEVLLAAGFDNEKDARYYAARFQDYQILTLITLGKSMKLDNPAGWLRRQMDRDLAGAQHGRG